MGNIIPFSSSEFSVRAVEIDGQPWFVGKDVCDALGYTNPNKAMGDHCKGVTKRYPLETGGGTQEVRVLPEADVLRLIVKSSLPAAEKFERWVFEDVLPAIRKTGAYVPVPQGNGSPAVQAAFRDATAAVPFLRLIGLDPNAAAISANQVAINLHGVNLLQLSGNTHLLAANQETQTLTPTALGKLLGGLSAQKVNRALEQAGLQKRVGDEWVPLPAAEGLYRLFDTGKKHSIGTPVTQLKWYAAAADRIKRSA